MFSKKTIRVEVQRISGEFYPGVSTLEFKDLPIEVDLNLVTLPSGISGRIKIYGVSKEHMRAITTLKWKQVFIDQKAVRVYVNDGDGEHLLFEGNIMSAVPDYNSAPDVCISIDACAGAYYNLKSDVSPSIVHKDAPTHLIFEKICKDFGVGFKNHGVDGSVSREQVFDQIGLSNRINAAARALNVYVVIENNTVHIYPNGDSYEANNWIFTKENYVGYPSFNVCGIEIKLDRLVKSISLADFFTIKDSEITAANDKWKILKIKYKLSTKIGGKWLCMISGLRVGVVQATNVLAGLNLT